MRSAQSFAFTSVVFLCLTGCGNPAASPQSSLPPPPQAAPEKIDRVVPVDLFLRALVGEYDILEAGPVGGEMKVFKDYVGTVELDGKDMLFTFPYCPPKEGCLPGYAYFALSSAAATRGDKSLTFKALLDDGSRGTFRWSEQDGHITFVNEQLEHSDGSKKAIEYHLRAR